ncbi:alkaline phosphatase family protein [Ammoniphilus resinae]|uniref:AlkP superfamily pyrophosphatase or phosphodiesterase n=1 Tax=Ammoniphilus resinae TaxID=861532 RepID=A0ABS4GMD0_9BACL|nr:alkaline phosphatase family protein [Ammoniphilus resinae]MBP1931425.1 putative AlkP superfamily pyrophosphatase or phosphodiesterase [Ammoniphilus resinae]
MINIRGIIILFFCLLMVGCGQQPDPFRLSSINTKSAEKKVILVIVDSLLIEPLETLMKQNKVPAFSFLKEYGFYTNQMVSSFPTMSVSIDSTVLTGTYPDQHHIPALRWYNKGENRLIHYGDGVPAIVKSGVKQVMEDGLFHLNNTHLSKNVKTIHEELEDQGIATASINNLVYRGRQKQTLQIPGPFKNMETNATTYFVLGTFHHYQNSSINNQYFKYYGFNNEVSTKHLVNLIQQQRLPALTIVYMPDLDHEAHKYGKNLVNSVVQVDMQLQAVLNAFGSWEQAIRNHTIIIMGDSGVTPIIGDEKEAIIDLEKLFAGYRIVDLEGIRSNDELALAVNERMSYIYSLKPNIKVQELADLLSTDARLDTISWKNGPWIEVRRGGSSDVMRVRKGTSYTDGYGQKWDIQGNKNVLNVRIAEQGKHLDYGAYPDAFMRIYAALHSHQGDYLVVTSKPGYEMKGTDSPTHVGGGAHGSFHEIDSYVPFFLTGTPERPKDLRIVQLKPLILQILEK